MEPHGEGVGGTKIERQSACESVYLTVECKLYLAGGVVQSQQVLLPTDIDAHCKEMTKSFEERRRGRGRGGWGAARDGGGRIRVPNPSLL